MAKIKRPKFRTKVSVRGTVRLCREGAVYSAVSASRSRQHLRPSVGPAAIKSNKLRTQENSVGGAHFARGTHGYTTALTVPTTDLNLEASTESRPTVSVMSRRRSTTASAFCENEPTAAQLSGMGKGARFTGVKLHHRRMGTHPYDKVGSSTTSVPNRSGSECFPVPRVRTLRGRQSAAADVQDACSWQHRVVSSGQQVQSPPEEEHDFQLPHQKHVRGRFEERRESEQSHMQREHQQQYFHAEEATGNSPRCSQEPQSETMNTSYVCQSDDGTSCASSSEKANGYPFSNDSLGQPLQIPNFNTNTARADLPERQERSRCVPSAEVPAKQLYELLKPGNMERELSVLAPWASEERCAASESKLRSQLNFPLCTEEMDYDTRTIPCEKDTATAAGRKKSFSFVQSRDRGHLWGFAHKLDHILDKLLESQWAPPRDRGPCIQNSEGNTVHSDASTRAGHTQDFDSQRTAAGTRDRPEHANARSPPQTAGPSKFCSSQLAFDSSDICEQVARSGSFAPPSIHKYPTVKAENISREMEHVGRETHNHEEHPQFSKQQTADRCFARPSKSDATSELGASGGQRKGADSHFARRWVGAHSMESMAGRILSPMSANGRRGKSASPSSEEEEAASSYRGVTTREGFAFHSCHTDEARERELQNFTADDGDSECSSQSPDGGSDVGEAKRLALVRQARMFPAVRGVYFDTRSGNLSWRCSWKTEGKKRSRSWSVLKFGMEGARAYAIAERLKHHSKACHTDDVARDFLRCFRSKRGPSPGRRRLYHDSATYCSFEAASNSPLPDESTVPQVEKSPLTTPANSSSFECTGKQQHSDGIVRQPLSPSASTVGLVAPAATRLDTLKSQILQHMFTGGTASEAALSEDGSGEIEVAPLQTNTNQSLQDVEGYPRDLSTSHPGKIRACPSLSLQNTDAALEQTAEPLQLADPCIDRSPAARERTRSLESVSSNATASPSRTICSKDQGILGRSPAHESINLSGFLSESASSRESHLFASLLSRLSPSFFPSDKTSSCGYRTEVEQKLPPSNESTCSGCVVAKPPLNVLARRKKMQLYRHSRASPFNEANTDDNPVLLPSGREYSHGACDLSSLQVMGERALPEDSGVAGKQLSFGHSPLSEEQMDDTDDFMTNVKATPMSCAGHETHADPPATRASKSARKGSNEGCQDDEKVRKGGETIMDECQAEIFCSRVIDRYHQTCDTAGTTVSSEKPSIEQERQHQNSSILCCWRDTTTNGDPPAAAIPPTLTPSTPRAVSTGLSVVATALQNNRLLAPCASSSAMAGAGTRADGTTTAATMQRSVIPETEKYLHDQAARGRCPEDVSARVVESAARTSQEKWEDSSARGVGVREESTERVVRRREVEEGTWDAGTEKDADVQKLRVVGSRSDLREATSANSPSQRCWKVRRREHRHPGLEEEYNFGSFFCGDGDVDCVVRVASSRHCDSKSDTERPSAAGEAEGGARNKRLPQGSVSARACPVHDNIDASSPPNVLQQQQADGGAICLLNTATSGGRAVSAVSLYEASDSTRVKTPIGAKPASGPIRQPVVSSAHLQHIVCRRTSESRPMASQCVGDVSGACTVTHAISSSHLLPLTCGSSSQSLVNAASSTDGDGTAREAAHAEDDGDTRNAEGDPRNIFSFVVGEPAPPTSPHCGVALPDAAATEELKEGVGDGATILQPLAEDRAELSKSSSLTTTAPPKANLTVFLGRETCMKEGSTGDMRPLRAILGQDCTACLRPDNEAASVHHLSSTRDSRESFYKERDRCNNNDHFAAVEGAEEGSEISEMVSVEKLHLSQKNSPDARKYWREATASAIATTLAHPTIPKPYYDDTPTTAPSPTADDPSTEGILAGPATPAHFEKELRVSSPLEAPWGEEEARCLLVSTWQGKDIDSLERKVKRCRDSEDIGEWPNNSSRTSASSGEDRMGEEETLADGPHSAEELPYAIDDRVKEEVWTTRSSSPEGHHNSARIAQVGGNACLREIDSGGKRCVQTGESNKENHIRRVVLAEGLLKLRESLAELLHLPAKESAKQESSDNAAAINSSVIVVFPRDNETHAPPQQRMSMTPTCSAELDTPGSGRGIQEATTSWCVDVFDELLGTLRLGVGTKAQEVLQETNNLEDIDCEAKNVVNHHEKLETFRQEWKKDAPGSVNQLEKTVSLLLSGFLGDIFVSTPPLLHYKRHALLAALITCFLNWKRLQSS